MRNKFRTTFTTGSNSMFVLANRRHLGSLVFFQSDPRTAKTFPTGIEVSQVTLYEPPEVHEWPDGTARPESAIGVSLTDPARYRVFKYSSEVAPAGFRHVASGGPLVFGDWADFCSKFDPAHLA